MPRAQQRDGSSRQNGAPSASSTANPRPAWDSPPRACPSQFPGKGWDSLKVVDTGKG